MAEREFLNDGKAINSATDSVVFDRFFELAKSFLSFRDVSDLIILDKEKLILGINNPNAKTNEAGSKVIRLDVVIIFDSYKNKSIENELKNKIEQVFPYIKANVEGVTQEELFLPRFSLRERVFLEGYSVFHRDYMSSLMGFKGYVLFKYNLSGLSNSKKMQFYYDLYGRHKEGGILMQTNSFKLSDSLVLVPVGAKENLKGFFKERGIIFEEIPVLLPNRNFNLS